MRAIGTKSAEGSAAVNEVLELVGKHAKALKWGGRASKAAPVVAVGIDAAVRVKHAYDVEEQYRNGEITDGQRVQDHAKSISGAAGGYAGGFVGMKAGATSGAVVGGCVGGPIGAGIGGVVGGIGGAVGGYVLGETVAEDATEFVLSRSVPDK